MTTGTQNRAALVSSALRTTSGALGGVFVLSGVVNVLQLTGSLFMLQIYDRVLASRSVPTLLALSLLVGGLYAFLGLMELLRSRVLIRIGARIHEQLGAPAFAAALRQPLQGASGTTVQPVRELDQLRQFMGSAGPAAICDLPWLPLYLWIIFAFDPLIGWLALAGGVALLAITLASEAALRGRVKQLAQLGLQRHDMVESGRRNAEALRAMGMVDSYATRWSELDAKYIAEQTRANDTAGDFSAISRVLRVALQSAVLALGAWLAIRGEITAGSMIAASILTSRALAPIEQAIGHWKGFVAARQSRRKLADVLEKLRDGPEVMPLPAPKKSLAVEALAIAPPGTTTVTLRDVNFGLAAGEGLAVIGPSGSGKSTLARALVGVWPALRGSIRLDGAELDQWTNGALGASVGYLPQDVELFAGTIEENIARFTPNADPGAIIAAAKLAGAHDLILSMPQGYATRIGESGGTLSGGQRQRIGLARALFGRPFLVVLDEPNSNLDNDGDIALTSAIAGARGYGAVVVVIAHRRSATQALDKVLVLSEGRQAAFGPRDEVLRKMTLRPVSSA